MTKKEKNLLVLVAAIAIFAVFWFLLYTPLEKKVTAKKADVDSLTAQLDQIKALYLNKETYEAEIADMKAYISEVETKFPGDMTQEMIIYTMIKLENAIPNLKIPGYALYPAVVLASDGEYMPENSETPAFKENFIEVGTELTLETSYDDLKAMLRFFKDSEIELSLKNLTLTNNLETGMIESMFTLNYYALRSEDSPYEPMDYFGPFDPKDDSIFKAYEGFGTQVISDISLAEAKEQDDFIINLSSINSDRTTVVMYKNGDKTNETYVYTDNSGSEPIELVFENEGTNYFYRYKTSKASYPETYTERVPFVPGKAIDLKVYVEARTDNNDKNGVTATLINRTDLPLKVEVVGDDTTLPRFKVGSQTGNIAITNVAN